MKIFLKIAVLLLSLLALFTAALYFVFPKPITEEYSAYQDAITGDPLKDHWIPDFVPHSAVGIHLSYGIEPSFQRLEFSYAAWEEPQITHDFEKVTNETDIRDVMKEIRRRHWKTEPEGELQLYVPSKHLNNPGKSPQYLAIDRTNRRVWHSLD